MIMMMKNTTQQYFSDYKNIILHTKGKYMHSNNFNKNVLDTLGLNVVLLDPDGMVVSYNKQWEKFAKNNNNPSLKNSDIGSNYLEVTKKAMLEGDKFAEKAFDGIMSIIKGQCNEFDLEYPCHSPNEKRWFIMHARKCIGQDLVVIYHENITDRKIAEENLKPVRKSTRSWQSQLMLYCGNMIFCRIGGPMLLHRLQIFWAILLKNGMICSSGWIAYIRKIKKML